MSRVDAITMMLKLGLNPGDTATWMHGQYLVMLRGNQLKLKSPDTELVFYLNDQRRGVSYE